jgi:hypothetical protein
MFTRIRTANGWGERWKIENCVIFLLKTRGTPVAPWDLMMARAKNPHAMALGRLGGLKGGRARAEKLSPRRRRQIARLAAETRWRLARG